MRMTTDASRATRHSGCLETFTWLTDWRTLLIGKCSVDIGHQARMGCDHGLPSVGFDNLVCVAVE